MEILLENKRRLEAISAPYDPITGLGVSGERFPLKLPDLYEGQTLYLPVEMEHSLIVDLLRRHGSVAEAARHYWHDYGPEQTMAEVATLEKMQMRLLDALARERILHDFPFWAATYVDIKCKGGGEDVKFVLNRPQRKFIDALENARRGQRPIRIILLKARQWGGSTCSQIYMAWLQLVHRAGLNSLIIAHQGAGSDEIKDMFDRMILAYPARLLHPEGEEFDPEEKKLVGVGRSRSIFRVPQRNCKIKIGTAERPDSCRGGDYNLVHLSEVGIWKSTDGKCPEDIVRSACSGILLKPMTMIVLESTANGTGNFFHREYLAAKRGESQFEPLFVSWYEIDQYSLPFASEKEKADFALRLWDNRFSEEQRGRVQSGRYLWTLWEKGATLEALHWFVTERLKYTDHAAMASEYPSDEVEAFAHSGMRVFDPYAVESLRQGCLPPLDIGIITSDGCTASRGCLERLSLDNPRFVSDPTEGLKVWHFPDWYEEGAPAPSHGDVAHRYLAVVDIGGRHIKADWTVITVFDRLFMLHGEPPCIAAQWRGHADLDVVAAHAARIAAFYENALLVIESNTLETRDRDRMSEGDTMPYVMSRLRDVYPNLYARTRSELDIREGVPVRYGFHTNTATKPVVISELVRAVRDNLYIERDEMAIEELLQYEQRPNGSYGAIAGCHDDILMTRAIGIHIAFNEMPMPRERFPTMPANSGRSGAGTPHHRVVPLSEANFL